MRSTSTTRRWRRFSTLAVGLLTLALVLPAASQGARPNPGLWDSSDWTNPLSFTVKAKKKKRTLVGFTPGGTVSYTCADTGEEVWTGVSNLSARISRSGAFSSTTTLSTSLNRLLTLTLSGQFTSPTNASGTLFWDLAGCGTFLSEWGAYGPERKHKKKKGGGGGGGGNNGDETCQWMPYPDGSYVWVCLPN